MTTTTNPAPEAHTPGSDPGRWPVSPQTQEVRFAMTFTGGVSLAIWMGGVAREVDLLMKASALRDQPPVPGGGVGAGAGADDGVREFYRQLLDLLDQQVRVDILSGTSAGGINAALLGLAATRGVELDRLRQLWLSAGSFTTLLRDPRIDDPPSLLKGDAHMLAALASGIDDIRRQPAAPGTVTLPTDVFITTTLLSPEHSRVTDDYGTELEDLDHHGQFHFTEATLPSQGTGDPSGAALALAARSSASFPVAFEPAYLPFTASDADATHVDMSDFANTTRSHWAADGGLLVNRPLGPILQTTFDRPAERQVRRCLLYVTPTTGSPTSAESASLSTPLGLAGALLRDAGAVLNQSIAADLAAIQDHNDRAQAASDTRLLMARLGSRLAPGQPLVDAETWTAFTTKESASLAGPLVAEVIRFLNTVPHLPAGWAYTPAQNQDTDLRLMAVREVTRGWPTDPPDASQAHAAAVQLGLPAYDGAKAMALRLIRVGYTLSSTGEQRQAFAAQGTSVHDSRQGGARPDLRILVKDQLTRAASAGTPLPDAVAATVDAYLAELNTGGDATSLADAWTSLSTVVADIVKVLEPLTQQPEPVPPWKRPAVDEARTYIQYLTRPRVEAPAEPDATTSSLLALYVATRAVLPVLAEVEQKVELIQISADTRTLLSPSRHTATDKLTGTQVHNFGAFYKTSWRANDWMWGRLDGCGWLVHVLLDPRRIVAMLENDPAVMPDTFLPTFLGRLAALVGVDASAVPDEVRQELGYLSDLTMTVPTSLPTVSTWVARQAQLFITQRELPIVAAFMRDTSEGTPAPAARRWLADYDTRYGTSDKPAAGISLAEAPTLLDGLPVPAETLAQERLSMTPLFIRTMTQTGAVATAAATAFRQPPAALRPTFATARSVTRTAYLATKAAGGVRSTMIWLSGLLIAIGIAGMVTNNVVLGVTGLVATLAGMLLLAICLGPTVVKVAQTVLALGVVLLAALPWLPRIGAPFFGWLSARASWSEVTSERWLWVALLLLVLLPPVTTVVDLARRRGRQAVIDPAQRP